MRSELAEDGKIYPKNEREGERERERTRNNLLANQLSGELWKIKQFSLKLEFVWSQYGDATCIGRIA